MSAAIDRSAIEAFVFAEARLLDERRFREWMALYTEDGAYWVPAAADQTTPFGQASLFYDDLELMRTRIDRLEHPLIHVQTPPSRTVHVVGNIEVEAVSAGPTPELPASDMLVHSSFVMVEYRLDQQRMFAGRQRHWLRDVEGALRIVRKRVDLVNSEAAFEAIAVPF
ncbi:MAG: aromatic-ring-hydroxylating dioxygenase subunit beta [Proteobacteria bacterium]|nr:aromatic-ring-hydroxylating dioxygenase subunit beta [Burkholderiales bacterium]